MYIDGHDGNGDLGSWVCAGVKTEQTYGEKQIREYFGLSSDAAKLPKYRKL